jgi:hypothetical protein
MTLKSEDRQLGSDSSFYSQNDQGYVCLLTGRANALQFVLLGSVWYFTDASRLHQRQYQE